MRLPAIREKISQLPRSKKLLFSFFPVIGILLIFILVGIASYFYFGYHRQKLPYKGVKLQSWYQGEKMDVVVGKVVERDGSRFKIENEGEEVTLDIVEDIFYCEEAGEFSDPTVCKLIDPSQVKEGMFITVDKKNNIIPVMVHD